VTGCGAVQTELVRRVARETGVSQRVVSQVLSTIQAALAAGEGVSFPGFGTFYTSQLDCSIATSRSPRHAETLDCRGSALEHPAPATQPCAAATVQARGDVMAGRRTKVPVLGPPSLGGQAHLGLAQPAQAVDRALRARRRNLSDPPRPQF
jgi:nucleoid DNA-binding protein